MNNTPKVRSEDIVVKKIGNEILIYDLITNKAVCLNETATIIWKQCDGKKEISEIAEGMSRKLDNPVADELVWLAIDKLNADNLLSNGEALPKRFEGLSRREVIRKVGVTSIVALPVISSIIAPQAAFAQSGACVTGCFPSGTDVCANCMGQTLVLSAYTPASGCTPPAASTSPAFTCTGPNVVGIEVSIDSIT